MSQATQKMKILFLCTGNSCRSQMAEGWARHLKGDRVEPASAGVDPKGVDPLAVQAMKEAGVEIGDQGVCGNTAGRAGRRCAATETRRASWQK